MESPTPLILYDPIPMDPPPLTVTEIFSAPSNLSACVNTTRGGQQLGGVPQPQDYVTFRIWVDVFFITFLCLVGFVGNVLSVAVLCHDSERNNTTNWLLQSLAVVDSLYLVTCLFIQPIKAINELTDWSPGLRRVFPLIEPHVWGVASTAQTMAVWVVLLITTDRFVAICMPWQPALRSVTRAKMAVALTVMAAVLYNMPRYFEREVLFDLDPCTNEMHVRTGKTALRNDKVYFLVYKTVCYFVFRTIGPLSALVYLNVRLIRALRLVRQRRSDLVSASSSRARNTENITLMLVVVVFVFVVCELPDLALRIAVTVQEFAPSVQLNIWTLRYINTITNTLLTLNSSVNFLIYCLVGHKFRRIFLRVYGCGCGGAAVKGVEFSEGGPQRGAGRGQMSFGGAVLLTEKDPILAPPGGARRSTVIVNFSVAVAELGGMSDVVEL